MSRRDPTGLRCEGFGDKSTCRIDEVNIGTSRKQNWVSRNDAVKSGKVSDAQLGRLEANILAVYRAAQKLGKDTVNVKGSAALGIADTKVSGDRIAMIMSDQNLRASNTPHLGFDGKETGAGATSRYGVGITFWQPSFTPVKGIVGEYQQQIAAAHEPLHFVPQLLKWGEYDREHQQPFNDAIEKLTIPRPW